MFINDQEYADEKRVDFFIALSSIFVSGCVTNQSSKTLQENSNISSAPAHTPVNAITPVNNKLAATPAAKIESQPKAAIKDDIFIADNRKESTGLLGKTVTAKNKYSKTLGTKIDHYNSYATTGVYTKFVFPEKTNVVYLFPEKRNKSKGIFAFVKEEKKTAYFIDIIEINIPKGYLLGTDNCNIGVIGLFKDIYQVGGHKKPEKAWTIVNGRFIPMTNFSKMECEDNSSGD
ncbi:MAG: hypothetical protein WCG50_09335 [Rhodoferax sp.]|uniref:hypothetical protein n=1 Tax=Rhodoferax sp. TaxID=50421 RepID=UPI0030159F83